MRERATSLGERRRTQISVCDREHVEHHIRSRRLLAKPLNSRRGGVKPRHQGTEVESIIDGPQQLAVDGDVGQSTQGGDDLGEVPAEPPLVAALKLDPATVTE